MGEHHKPCEVETLSVNNGIEPLGPAEGGRSNDRRHGWRAPELARTLADFWYGGAGPSHGELDRDFDDEDVEVDGGSKRDRMREAVETCPEAVLPRLLAGLVELLNRLGLLTSPGGDPGRDLPPADGPDPRGGRLGRSLIPPQLLNSMVERDA